MSNYSFHLPSDFNDYEQEVAAKGFFSEAKIIHFKKSYRMSFYDPARLSQEMEDEVQRNAFFFESNLVIVPAVTGSAMARAAELLVRSGRANFLIPD